MKLNSNDRLWAPMDNPRYLLVLPQGTPGPETRAQFLAANIQLLHRLCGEAGDEEIQEANRLLADNLEPEVLDWLPQELLNNPKTAELLTGLQLVEGSPLHEWKMAVDEALSDPRMPETEAMEEAQYLTLVGRISQMIEA